MHTACRPSRLLAGMLAVSAAAAFAAPATQSADAIARIRDEGLNRSKVSDSAEYLCNVIGPRLTASPAVRRANDWTRQTLVDWGLADAHLEPWGPFGRGWEVESFSVRVDTPYGFAPVAAPKAWSGGFAKPVTAPIIYLDTKTEAGLEAYKDKVKGAIVLIGQPRATPGKFEPQATRMTDERLASLGNLPLYTKRATLDLMQSATAPATTQSATDVVATAPSTRPAIAAYPTSGPAAIYDPASTQPTSRPATRRASTRIGRINTTQSDLGPTTRRSRRPTTGPGARPTSGPTELAAASFATKALAFAVKNGAACVMTPSTVGDGGTLFVTQAALDDTTPRKGPSGATTQPRVWWPDSRVLPQIMTTAEDFNRLVSLTRHGITPTATVDLKVRLTDNMPQQYNTIAELPGTDLAEQIVMCGGHMDSWHSATGATDNVAGTVVAMEAIRILKAAGVQPRRTIRVALWTGEEQGLLGSSAHVRQNYATLSTDPPARPTSGPASQPLISPATTPATEPTATAPLAVANVTATKPASTQASVVKVGPAYDQFSVYFNLDNGTGRIRGIFGENNVGAIALFKEWIKPLGDLGCTTVTTDTTGSTDHVCFNRVGLPGFQFIQDPIEYFPRTHHSNIDTFDRLQIDDLKQASVVMATFLYNAAMTDEPMPRKALGK